MRNLRTLALGAMMLVLVGACSSGGGKPTIKIGSDGFYESKLMGEIYAQALEANGYTVQRYLQGGALQVTGATCAGLVNAVSCTETAVPGGHWQYH